MERKPVTQQKLEIQSLIDQLGSALESYYDDSEREVEYFGGIFSENEEDAVGMIRRGYAKLEAAWIEGSRMINDVLDQEPFNSEDDEEEYQESTQYDKIILESNKWMYGEELNEATKKAKDKQVKPEEIATAIKKWVDKKKPFETTDNGTEKYEMNIEMGKPSPIGFNNNEIKKDLAKIKKSLQDKYKGKFSKVKLSTNKYYLLIDLIK